MIRIIALSACSDGFAWNGVAVTKIDAIIGWNLPSLPSRNDKVRLPQLGASFVLIVNHIEWTPHEAALVGEVFPA